eukprot:Cvel_21362.t1-p1 / transcript=Cvel_21362.t1 / gene=Cvel_21362 / organism=Chromera_velia_CCMP2878 / gene_product=hypothetical protein / transcript_product=hypothetical protein / location=Cvel_scaffold1997:1-1768(-) / protein_length=322 / sequence_SO=supercontig / SO=protein_coding / is_pseudo=false
MPTLSGSIERPPSLLECWRRFEETLLSPCCGSSCLHLLVFPCRHVICATCFARGLDHVSGTVTCVLCLSRFQSGQAVKLTHLNTILEVFHKTPELRPFIERSLALADEQSVPETDLRPRVRSNQIPVSSLHTQQQQQQQQTQQQQQAAGGSGRGHAEEPPPYSADDPDPNNSIPPIQPMQAAASAAVPSSSSAFGGLQPAATHALSGGAHDAGAERGGATVAAAAPFGGTRMVLGGAPSGPPGRLQQLSASASGSGRDLSRAPSGTRPPPPFFEELGSANGGLPADESLAVAPPPGFEEHQDFQNLQQQQYQHPQRHHPYGS